MTEGAIHEISRTLGELLAGQKALDQKIDRQDETIKANHSDAERHWDAFYEKLKEVNHATANLAMADVGHVHALRNMGEKLGALEMLPEAVAAVDRRVAAVEVVNDRVGAMEDRLGKIDRLMLKVTILGGGAAGLAAFVSGLLMRYGADLWHWIAGK